MIDARVIHQTARQVNHLDAQRKNCFALRHSSAQANTAWAQACDAFRNYSSPLWDLWSPAAQRSIVEGSGYWRDVALLYLSISPRFFRSGYLRDRVCHVLKQSALTANEQLSVQTSLLQAIAQRPSVGGFKYDCRLATAVADQAFCQRLYTLCLSEDPWIKDRAQSMEKHLQKHPRLPLKNTKYIAKNPINKSDNGQKIPQK